MTIKHCQSAGLSRSCGDCKHAPANAPDSKPRPPIAPTVGSSGSGAAVKGEHVSYVDLLMRCGRPAEIARHRLREIVEVDRENVPCGRWVRRSMPPMFWRGAVAIIESSMRNGRPYDWLFPLLRPRYRWEVRR